MERHHTHGKLRRVSPSLSVTVRITLQGSIRTRVQRRLLNDAYDSAEWVRFLRMLQSSTFLTVSFG